MNLTINDKTVSAREGQTVLDCALEHGISIPHLCTHPDLPPFGACRMCVVQIRGMRGFPTACTTPAGEGMVVQTDTPELQDLRRRILELMMLEHPSACLICDRQELCERYRPKSTKAGRTTGCHTCNNREVCEVRALADQLHLHELPVAPVYRDLPIERADPFIERDLNLCILCGRCVRICKAHHGWGVIDFVGRGSETRIGEAFGRSLTEAGCRFCGSCIDVCPTGSLVDRYAKWYGQLARSTETTCMLCDAGCAIKVSASDHGRAVTARAVDSASPICVLGRFGVGELLSGVGRLTVPRVRVGQVLREVTWEQALQQAAQRLAPLRQPGGAGAAFALVCDPRSCTLEDRRVFERFTREVMGSPHYVEVGHDGRGRIVRTRLPAGVTSALLTGELVEPDQLEQLELLLIQDCYPSPTSDKQAHFVLPAAVFAEISGTVVDGGGTRRPLSRACDAPGKALADWRIVCDLARALGHDGLGSAYQEVSQITAELDDGATGALLVAPASPPGAALEPRQRWTHFRGHVFEEKIRGLREIPAAELPASDAAGG